MNGKKDISKMNSRITIQQWNVTQDAGGGSSYLLANSFEVWAQKKQVFGSQGNTEAIQQWSYETTFKVRSNEHIKSNMTVLYDGVMWLINSIDVADGEDDWFMNLRCSKTDINIDVS